MIKMQEILDMSVAERILIIEKIWNSINPDDIATSETIEQELDNRLARYNKGVTTFITWNDVKDELRTYK